MTPRLKGILTFYSASSSFLNSDNRVWNYCYFWWRQQISPKVPYCRLHGPCAKFQYCGQNELFNDWKTRRPSWLQGNWLAMHSAWGTIQNVGYINSLVSTSGEFQGDDIRILWSFGRCPSPLALCLWFSWNHDWQKSILQVAVSQRGGTGTPYTRLLNSLM